MHCNASPVSLLCQQLQPLAPGYLTIRLDQRLYKGRLKYNMNMKNEGHKQRKVLNALGMKALQSPHTSLTTPPLVVVVEGSYIMCTFDQIIEMLPRCFTITAAICPWEKKKITNSLYRHYCFFHSSKVKGPDALCVLGPRAQWVDCLGGPCWKRKTGHSSVTIYTPPSLC